MFGHFGEASPSADRPYPGGLEPVRTSDGAFDRLAELARFLLDGDVAIVDLTASTVDMRDGGSGIAFAPGARVALLRRDVAAIKDLADPLTALALGYAGQASVPIRIGREQIGTLAVLSKDDRAFNSRDVEILRKLAALAAERFILRMGVTRHFA